MMSTHPVPASHLACAVRFEPPLTAGTLVRRYQRFLADVRLAGGREVVAWCMNTGAMTGLAEPGSAVWLSPDDRPERKLKWTWQLASEGGVAVGVNTQLPNQLAAQGAAAGVIEALAGYAEVRREARYTGTEHARSRADLLLTGRPGDPRPCWVEVKSATLALGDGVVAFPDAPTSRGLKHLEVLQARVAAGERAVLLLIAQRGDAQVVRPADAIDPAWSQAAREAARRGVEVLAWQAHVSPERVALWRALPVDLRPPAP
jgi:sugar fermentation stimulation protein A